MISTAKTIGRYGLIFRSPISIVALEFYRAVLGVGVDKETFGDFSFCVIEHHDGNGGCLVLNKEEIAAGGVLLLKRERTHPRRSRQSRAERRHHVQDTHPIGPHGFRAVVLDSEGNRIALHSEQDA